MGEGGVSLLCGRRLEGGKERPSLTALFTQQAGRWYVSKTSLQGPGWQGKIKKPARPPNCPLPGVLFLYSPLFSLSTKSAPASVPSLPAYLTKMRAWPVCERSQRSRSALSLRRRPSLIRSRSPSVTRMGSCETGPECQTADVAARVLAARGLRQPAHTSQTQRPIRRRPLATTSSCRAIASKRASPPSAAADATIAC